MKKIKVMHVGLGPLGKKIIGYMSDRVSLDIIGAVDINPEIAGKDLGEVCSLGRVTGISVAFDINKVIAANKPDVAVLTTVSDLKRLVPQIESIAKYGISIISTCEELSYPWKTQPELAKLLDDIAKKNNISILATGVNPGFLMDYLPVALTGICQNITGIRISRIQDASKRRIPFQKKIGAGLTLRQFEEKKQAGTLRHVGLTESVHMIADRMGWELDRTEDILTPIVAEEEIKAGYCEIKPGMARGVQQIGIGYKDGEAVITLVFKAAVGEAVSVDTVEIKGLPDIISTISGGVNGDIATCAITINAIRSVIDLQPGLKTMLDLPVVSYFNKL